MADTPTAELVPFPDQLHVDGDAVDKLAALGAKATGIDLLTVEYESEIDGLPKTFPVAVLHGERPELRSVKALAEEWRTHPQYRSGTATALTLISFIDLLNRHKTPDSVVFADSDWKKPAFTAVLDYHPANDADDAGLPPVAANGKHRIRYAFPLSEEWKSWIAGNGEWMEQADFAAMIEDRIADLTAPTEAMAIWMQRDFQTTIATPAQLITLSRGLSINVESKVKNHVTLQSGAGQLVFEETHSGADGQPIAVPGLFVLHVSPFFMGDPIDIPVRLRYRVRGGKIMWAYQIYRPDQSVTEAVRHAMGDVRNRAEVPVFEGAPEMSAEGAPVRVI